MLKPFRAYSCSKCEATYLPERPVCLKCRNREFTPVEIEGDGVVLTYTKLWSIPEGIEKLPLLLGIVEFQNRLRVTGQIEAEQVDVGTKVRPVWGILRKVRGREITGFKYIPI